MALARPSAAAAGATWSEGLTTREKLLTVSATTTEVTQLTAPNLTGEARTASSTPIGVRRYCDGSLRGALAGP